VVSRGSLLNYVDNIFCEAIKEKDPSVDLLELFYGQWACVWDTPRVSIAQNGLCVCVIIRFL
jgi:hypothetical protein